MSNKRTASHDPVDTTHSDKRRKLNSSESQQPYTPSDDAQLNTLRAKAKETIEKISSQNLPTWSLREFWTIVKPFVDKDVADFDPKLALIRFNLLESMAPPDCDDDDEQQKVDQMMEKYEEWTKNYVSDQQTVELEVSFKQFFKHAAQLIKCEDYSEWKQTDVDAFVLWWAGRAAVDCVGNLDSAAIIDDFLNGEWERYLQQHPTVRAIVRPFYVFVDWNPVNPEPDTDDDNEEQSSSYEALFDEWATALDHYPPASTPNLKFPKQVEGNKFVFCFEGNQEGRRRAFNFTSFMRQKVPGARFWCTRAPALIRV